MEEFDARRAAMELVTAFVNNHQLTAAELPTLLSEVFNAIAGFSIKEEIAAKTPASTTAAEAPNPALVEAAQAPATASMAPSAPPAPAPIPVVSIEASVSNPDFIISLITGEKLKTLKRHLRAHGLTEAEYRERYNLPGSYPFVAPTYSKMRRDVAQKMGLGQNNAVVGKVQLQKSPAPAPIPAPATGSDLPRPSEAAKTKAAAKTTSKPVPSPKPDASTAPKKVKSDRRAPASKITPPADDKIGETSKPSRVRPQEDSKARRSRRGKLSPVFG